MSETATDWMGNDGGVWLAARSAGEGGRIHPKSRDTMSGNCILGMQRTWYINVQIYQCHQLHATIAGPTRSVVRRPSFWYLVMMGSIAKSRQ